MSSDPLERQHRKAARVVLLRSDGRVLLLRGGDPQRPEVGTWWFTPGGGLEGDESSESAARRELLEETGLDVAEVGEVVLRREVEFQFDGMIYEQAEEFFLVRTGPFDVDTSRWTDLEIASVVEHRWWSVDDLRTTSDRIFPEGLADLVERANAG
jgi:8-oxo-dGTP pyrophosphatase MutT (NUDIX family)